MSVTRARFSRVSARRFSVSLAPLLVARDAGGLLEEHAQLLGLGLDDARDHALLDDRVGARPEAGAEEHVGDVAPAHVRAVDVVAGLAVALQHALDRDLGVLRPLPRGAAQRVVEDQLDRGARERLAVARAVEDHVLHRIAAQRRGARFAQHPAHGVDDVRFAAAVRADDADQLAGNVDRGGIDEGLESGKLDLSEAHATNDNIARRFDDTIARFSGLIFPAFPMPSRPQQAPGDFRQSDAGARLPDPHGDPGVHLPVPDDRPAGFRHAGARLRSRTACAWS